jgi:ABC-type branched-subunit amino acid transport system substrate-binding protein
MCARLSSTVYLWLVVIWVISIESQKNIPLSIGFLSPFNYPPNLYAQIVRHTGRFSEICLTESTETGITMRHAVLIFSLRQGGQPAGLAFTVAIEEINARSDILPNHQLVPQVSTSNTDNGLTIQATFELITQKQIKGLVGEYTSEATQMARCHLKLYVIHVTVNLYSPLQRTMT